MSDSAGVRLGLFDIFQVDPADPADTATVYRRRLDDLALADDLGFSVAFAAERHFLLNYRCPAATAWVAAASQRTRSMRLGVMAYTLPIRAPVQLAEEVAVLDQLTGGRLEVGLGLGHRVEELIALGVDPAQRIPIYQKRLALLRGLWTGARASIESPHTVARDVVIHPLPVQKPHPPLWHAGTEPVGAKWVGAQGIGLAVGFQPTALLRPTVAAFREGQREQPADIDGPERPCGSLALMRHVYVADSDVEARRDMVADLTRIAERQPTGSQDRLADVETRADELIRNEVMIAGGPETVAAAIDAARRALGIDLFLANPYAAGIDDARVQRTLRLLAGPVRESLGGGRRGQR